MRDLEHIAIERLKAASEMSLQHYEKPLVICISGGKDSSVITELAIRAGIPVEFMHNHTTADAPETVYFVRSEFKRLEELGYQCTLNMPTYKGKRVSMWSLIPQKLFPPTRKSRYCCSVLKEKGGAGRFIATGVRWAESNSRSIGRGIYEKNGDKDHRIILMDDNDERRRLFENCRLKSKRTVNPIIDWDTKDVYTFLINEKVPINPLYKEGFCRIGCIGCPLASKKDREEELSRWPKYKSMYLNAFSRMLDERKNKGTTGKNSSWETPEDVMNWYLEYSILPDQMEMEDFLREDDDE